MARGGRILLLGGGYVSITLAKELRRDMRDGSIDLTVVSRDNYHVFHGLLADMLTGRIAAGHILSPTRRMISGARLHVGEITSIDLAEKTVMVSRHLDGHTQELHYDQVIFAIGSVDNLAVYPGLAEHAFKLKTFDDCFRLRNHIRTMFELADIESDPLERRRLLTFFIAGGGFAGTEVAGELAHFIRLLTEQEYASIGFDECRVVIVHPGANLLPELYGGGGQGHSTKSHPKLVDYAAEHMRKLGVEIMTGTRITAASPSEVALSNGERVPTHTIISAVGTTMSPLLDGLGLPRDERGRVVTDEFLRVEGMEGVWAAGDCAAIPHPKGGTCPPVALYAMKEGRYLARNIRASVQGEPLKPFTWRGLGQAVSIGQRTAVGELKGFEVTGLPCWIIWKALCLRYVPTWDRRVRILADWAISPLVGRDIVEMSVADSVDYDIRHRVYQPGETIVAEGRAGHLVYLIVEGSVEVVRHGDDGERVLRVLGQGEPFGQVWLDSSADESARAKTTVEVVTLRSDQTRSLQKLLRTFQQLVTASDDELQRQPL